MPFFTNFYIFIAAFIYLEITFYFFPELTPLAIHGRFCYRDKNGFQNITYIGEGSCLPFGFLPQSILPGDFPKAKP